MKSEKLSSNYIYSLIYRVSICLLPLIVTPYLTRVLSEENNGLYVFTSTVACFFIMFCKLGLESYGNRCIAVCRDDENERSRTFLSIFSLQLISSAISILSYLVFVVFLADESKTVYWLQFLYVLTGLFDVSWFFYGIEKFRLATIRSLISRGLIVGGIFIFVKNADDILPYTLIMSACFLLEQLMLFAFLPRYVRLTKIGWADVFAHVKPNLMLFVPILAFNIYHWVDKLMLGIICQKEDVAYYNYAESIISLPKGILQALGAVLMPRIAYLAAMNAKEKCRAMFKDSIEIISFLSCGMCFGILGVASVFVPLFLGDKYQQSVILAMELAIVVIPMSLSDLIQNAYLVPFKKDKINMLSVSIGAVVNIIFNSALIPVLGTSGAVIATLGAGTIVFIYLFAHIRSFLGVKEFAESILPYLLIGLCEAAVALLIARLSFSRPILLVMQVAAAGGTYLILCVLYYFIRKRLKRTYINPISRMLSDMSSAEVGKTD